MSIAGKKARLKIAGTGIATTGQAMTLVSGKTYKITDRTKKVWDRTQTVTVYDGGSEVSSDNIASYQYLSGVIIFADGYTVTGAVTVDATYKPLTFMGYLRGYDREITADLADTTSFCTTATDNAASSQPHRRKEVQLLTASGSLNGFYDTDDNFRDVFDGGSAIILEFQDDYSDTSLYVIMEVKLSSNTTSLDIENPSEITVDFESTFPVEYEPQ